jgi:hypothetical protein
VLRDYDLPVLESGLVPPVDPAPGSALESARRYARQGVHLAGANPAPVDRSWAG